jgi:putative IMPACT (imprinted ancient) family translation regulator
VVAYKTASKEALDASTIEERFVKSEFQACIPYTEVDRAMRTIRSLEAEILSREYTAHDTILTLRCRLSRESELKEKLGVTEKD